MNKQQLQQEIADLQKQLEEKQKALSAMPDKWEPEGGEHYVSWEGFVRCANSTDDARFFGVEYTTLEQAEKAAKAMRAHNRLLAYVAEFAPDWEPDLEDGNWCIYFDVGSDAWGRDHSYLNVAGTVYMPYDVAVELCEKLNSGEVQL